MTSTQKNPCVFGYSFNEWWKKIIGLDPLKKLESALDHALENHGDAKHIIFSGDLAHDGDRLAYQSLKKVTNGINIPITFMMGNHDHRATFAQVFISVGLDRDGFLQSRVCFGTHQLIFLDTLQHPSSSFNRNKGFLCSERLSWLDENLSAAKDKKVIIFMHHPAFPVKFKAMDQIRLVNYESFLITLEKYQNVIHLISAQIHRTISGNFHGYGFSIFKSTWHQMPMQCESDNVSLSVAEPGAYGILFLRPKGLIVHTEDFELKEKNKKIFNDYK
ncbi:MAG: metallophosphoesterase [Paracoccaceae bacterium]|nr:metallophosphoesterase [Paracoccaceae bacterium]